MWLTGTGEPCWRVQVEADSDPVCPQTAQWKHHTNRKETSLPPVLALWSL